MLGLEISTSSNNERERGPDYSNGFSIGRRLLVAILGSSFVSPLRRRENFLSLNSWPPSVVKVELCWRYLGYEELGRIIP